LTKGSLYNKKWRENNPEMYAYLNLVHNAKRRNKPCTITFEYFKKFCRKTKYIQRKGIWKYSYSIDCKINELGYVEGNLQLLTVSANSIKGTKKVEWCEGGKFKVI
jgi:hypothetical protein